MSGDSAVDPTTGHTVVHISRLPGKDSASLYFHQNSFTAAGDKMIFLHSGLEPGITIYTLDVSNTAAIGSGKTTRIANIPGHLIGYPVLGPVGRNVFYYSGQSIMETNLDTQKTRTVANLPSDWDYAPQSLQGLTLNANETLLAGTDTMGAANVYMAATPGGAREDSVTATFNAKLPSFIFTVDVKTGRINTILKGTDWYDHVQFSPTDPNLLMFAHEGPGDKVDRIWTIHADGSGLTNVRPRQVQGEVAGHEFWAPDGKTIWFKDQAPGKVNSFIGKNIVTGKETVEPVQPDQVSMHYNSSKDGREFVGDGGHNDPAIFLYVPQPGGGVKSEELCAIPGNDYKKREPNPFFTPDGRWVIFSSNQSGTTQVYAVSVGK
jgi:oligogalacturonide lyase